MDYYQILNVDKNATLDEIKRKRKELSYKYHPDSLARDETENTDPEMIKKINQAYEVLSDPEKRKLYDMGLDPNSSNQSFNPFGDLFNMFGAFGNKPSSPQPIVVELNVSLDDIYDGKVVTISINRNIKCDVCKNGFQDGIERKCKECSGAGIKNIQNQIAPGFMQVSKQVCRACSGTGKDLSDMASLCKQCLGTSIRKKDKDFTFCVSNIVDSKQPIIIFNKEGNTDPKTGLTGDVVFVIKPSSSEFERQGKNLHKAVKISLKEAFGGLNKDIKLPGKGGILKLENNNLIKDGEERIYKGFGIKSGDVHILYEYDYPEKLTEDQVSKLQTIF